MAPSKETFTRVENHMTCSPTHPKNVQKLEKIQVSSVASRPLPKKLSQEWKTNYMTCSPTHPKNVQNLENFPKCIWIWGPPYLHPWIYPTKKEEGYST
jgi:hypothetical protein